MKQTSDNLLYDVRKSLNLFMKEEKKIIYKTGSK